MTTRLFAPSSTRSSPIGLIVAFLLIVTAQICSGAYYGKLIGKLSELHHGVSGEVYAVDARTLFIKDFTYDGEGPAAFFYVGNSKNPNNNGFRVRDEHGTTNVLKQYRKRGITLTLPDGKTLNNIKWFSVWCDEFSVNFGDVKIPRGFDYPKPQKLKSLSGIHGVSSEPVVIVDAQTLLVSGFSYDGEAPDAKFWVGAGPTPSPQGIRVPDENGKVQPLRRYDRKTIVLTLPGDLTVHQLGHFGVWCEAFAVDFGHVQIPQNLNVPPSLKMLGVSPQSKLNCEVLEDNLAFEVRWAIAGDSIVVQLVGKLDAGQYMSFGLSANPEKSMMIGGDVVVAWIDKQTLQGYAIDYFLDAKSQCSGRRGSCPDTRIQENTGSVRLLNAAMVNDYSIVTYQRPLKASDEFDRPIFTNGSQAVIWAIGPLNERQEVSFHHNAYLKADHFIDFGRPPAWNCPMPDQEQTSTYGEINATGNGNRQLAAATMRRPQLVSATPAPAPTNDAWEIPPIQCNEPDDGVFYAQMGPTGGKHGYPAITGHVGWGIAWYINGLLIPVINVVRGKKYTFIVEGGLDPDIPARYHPFYITDDPVGGYQHKTPEEKAKTKIFAGVSRQRGVVRPTGVGRLCNWVPDQNQPPADEFASFGAYQRTLTLECDHGDPGFVEWTPDENTPDTVYYQCFTHRYLGWKINVLDSCDVTETAASEKHEEYVLPQDQEPRKQDLEYGASIAVESKVMPPTAESHHQQHVHHFHREHGQGHRYTHHSATNPANKLSVSHHSQLLTNANNKYDRLQLLSKKTHNSGMVNTIVPHWSYETRLKNDAYHVDGEAFEQSKQKQQQQQQQKQQQQPQQKPTATSHEPSFVRTDHSRFTELSRTTQQQTTNQQLSNLVADHQRPLSHGTKLPYAAASVQLPYSKAPHHYASNYHHYVRHQLPPHRYHHQPEQRTQLMIIRRPILTRRPMLQPTGMISSGTLALPLPLQLPLSLSIARPIFIERKKSVYRLPTVSVVPILKPTPDNKAATITSVASSSLPLEKLAKVDATKQRAKLEAKMSEAASVDISEKLMSPVKLFKPARNTGFDPDSIVVESGFKPIIRNVIDKSDVAHKKISGATSKQEDIFGKSSNYRTIDEFSPVFIPSLPMKTSLLDNGKKRKKKVTLTRFSPRFDDLDDMEMAADRLDAYYLPPVITGARSEELSPPSPDVLITYDGKRLKDSSGLAKSISDIEHRSKSKLTSAVLNKTPQFGKFQGELPPLIPREVRANSSSSSYERKRRLPNVVSPIPLELVPKANTRLTLIERSKRSTLYESRTMSSVDFQRDDSYHPKRGFAENRRDRLGAVSGSEIHLGSFGAIALITIATYFVL